jgi:hypothetical protein
MADIKIPLPGFWMPKVLVEVLQSILKKVPGFQSLNLCLRSAFGSNSME